MIWTVYHYEFTVGTAKHQGYSKAIFTKPEISVVTYLASNPATNVLGEVDNWYVFKFLVLYLLVFAALGIGPIAIAVTIYRMGPECH